LGKKAKTPRLTGNRGVLKIACVLEFHSHAAKTARDAHPNGQMAIGGRVPLNLLCECGFHS
jgi:hypothetical protein